jgi:hypothetical protein
LLYWTLAKDVPVMAHKAVAELHRRAFHLDTNEPDWALTADHALWLIRREGLKNPEFARAMFEEIVASPCAWHAGMVG